MVLVQLRKIPLSAVEPDEKNPRKSICEPEDNEGAAMSKVKITIEHKGCVEVVEQDGLFFVAFSETDDGMIKVDSGIVGSMSKRLAAENIAESLLKIDAKIGSRLSKEVAAALMLASIFGVSPEEGKEEE